MLDIKKNAEGTALTLSLEGRIDTDTASKLGDEIAAIPADVTSLMLDMQEVEYVASSGLRVLLIAAKTMGDRGGSCVLRNLNETTREVFEMTGLLGVFTVE